MHLHNLPFYLKLDAVMLTCKCVTGRHTTDNIVTLYEDVINNFCITNKVSNIITDNTSKNTKAFQYYHNLLGFHNTFAEPDSDQDFDSEYDEPDATTSDKFTEDLFMFLPQYDGHFAHIL